MTQSLRSLRHLLALLRIAILLARHDALFELQRLPFGRGFVRLMRIIAPPKREVAGLRPGERLALALPRLGPTFIKLGQTLSTRSDLVGEQLAADLSTLQDRLPPFPTEEAIRVLQSEFGQPIGQLFSQFAPEAVAAASVAQVHFATTNDGRDVAVKVLRPNIAEAFARDLDLLLWLAEILQRLQPGLRRLKLIEVVGRLNESVQFEMDLRLEAAAASELSENFVGDTEFRVPAVDWQRTSKRVLTTERVQGIPVGAKDALIAAGHDPREIVRKSAAAFFNMVFRDGFFHADLHPGNLFVAPDGAIVAVDFGIMGRLDRKHRYYLADMLLAFLTGDYRRVAQIHFDLGFVPSTQSVENFTQACRAIGEPVLERPLEEISIARLLSQLFETTHQFKMETQPQLLLLQKTMVLAEGLGRQLSPSTNMWTLARPLIEDWMRVHRSAPARAITAATELIASLERFPAMLTDLEKTFKMLGDGGLRLHPDSIRALNDARGSALSLGLPLWVAAAALAVLAVAAVRLLLT